MLPKKRELMYWKSSAGVRADIVRSLEAEGYTVKIANKLEDILDVLQRRQLSAVLVDASDSESETTRRAVELTSTERLFSIPLLFISALNKDVTPQLTKQFTKLISLSGNIDLNQMLADLDVACQGKAKDSSQSTLSPPKPIVGKSTEELRIQLSNHLDPARLHASYGGTVFAFATRPGIFDDKVLLPPHPKLNALSEMLNELTRANRLLGTHARRVCYLGSALASGAGFNENQDQVVRASSLLLNMGQPPSDKLFNIDFLYDEIEESAELLARAFDDAGKLVQRVLEDESISRTIHLVADILRRKEMFDSPEQILSSQCVLLAEIAGRACWKNSTWSANGAYRVIRELRNETRYALDASLVTAMCRILNEASCARHAAELAGSRFTQEEEELNRALAEEASAEAKTLFTNIIQEEIDIAEIKSGMRLAHPILTIDGKLIVRANVRLDKQMIWSLWQLVAIAPVTRKISIVKEPYTAVEDDIPIELSIRTI